MEACLAVIGLVKDALGSQCVGVRIEPCAIGEALHFEHTACGRGGDATGDGAVTMPTGECIGEDGEHGRA